MNKILCRCEELSKVSEVSKLEDSISHKTEKMERSEVRASPIMNGCLGALASAKGEAEDAAVGVRRPEK